MTSQSVPMTELGNMTPQIWGLWEGHRPFCGLIAAAATVREVGNASVAQARLQNNVPFSSSLSEEAGWHSGVPHPVILSQVRHFQALTFGLGGE